MKKPLLIAVLLALWGTSLLAQTLMVVSPPDLTYPYEVTAGTSVTFRLTAFQPPDAIFTYSAEPVFPEFGADPKWTQHTDFTDNGDGSYNITLNISEPTFVWGGIFGEFLGRWDFSNVIEVGIASGVIITAPDKTLCSTSDTETLSISGSYTSYQWYKDNEIIPGATGSTYAAKAEGYYKVQVPRDGKQVFSNTIRVKIAAVSMTGALQEGQLVLTATEGMASYQWLKGTSTSLSPITSATTATYTPALTSSDVYYAIKAVVGGCTVQSAARPAKTSLFTIPEVSISAPKNSAGYTCEGTTITASVPNNYETYAWFIDNTGYGNTNIITPKQDGAFRVEVTPKNWPEITIVSAEETFNYYVVIKPVMSGINDGGFFCPNSTVSITLGDEGYNYSWYNHTGYAYTPQDKVTVPGYEYSFTFQDNTYVTIVAEWMGCQSESRLQLRSYDQASFYLDVSDYDQLFLCPNSSITLSASQNPLFNFSSYQWYKNDAPVNGKTSASYTINATGTYYAKAVIAECPAITLTSNSQIIQDYSARVPSIWADSETICKGEQTTLHIGEEWSSPQWFVKKIVFGKVGYDETYVALPGGGAAIDQAVNDFNTYVVKARHNSCPGGLKTTSEPFQIRPTVNPTVIPQPNKGVHIWRKAAYDSIADYVYCMDTPVTLKLSDEYEYTSIKWYESSYKGDNNFVMGNEMAGETDHDVNVMANSAVWYTAEVTYNGCKGYSDPVLIDTYVHNTPDVESRDNAELCQEGDSTLLRIAFPGDWVKIEWYRDDELVPNSDNDTLYAKIPGGYTVTGYPADCPDIGYNSGLPAPVTMFPKATIEEDNSLIYAMPEYGFYSYEWYLDGEPTEPDDDYPWVIFKSDLQTGVYTVRVTNPRGCNALSDGFSWVVTGVEQDPEKALSIYPNPTDGLSSLGLAGNEQIKTVTIYNPQGQAINAGFIKDSMQIDLSNHPGGVYVVEVILTNGSIKKTKLIRH